MFTFNEANWTNTRESGPLLWKIIPQGAESRQWRVSQFTVMGYFTVIDIQTVRNQKQMLINFSANKLMLHIRSSGKDLKSFLRVNTLWKVSRPSSQTHINLLAIYERKVWASSTALFNSLTCSLFSFKSRVDPKAPYQTRTRNQVPGSG